MLATSNSSDDDLSKLLSRMGDRIAQVYLSTELGDE